MMKYVIECGAFITSIRKRTYRVSAKDIAEAKEKVMDKFESDMKKSPRNLDVGHIHIDFVDIEE